jgi:NDP-sugar pyrophosphorylase family protein
MKLLLIHTDGSSYGALAAVVPPALLPLLDKPVIQHQIELAYSGGLREVVVLASDGLDRVSAECGNGDRYGVELELRIGSRDGDETTSLMKHRSLLTERLLVITGLRIPALDIGDAERRHVASGRPLTLIRDSAGDPMAVILDPPSREHLTDGKGPLLSLVDDLAHRASAAVHDIRTDSVALVGEGLSGLLELNRQLLRDPSPLADISVVQDEPGVYLGRNVSIHATAKIHPPVLIGDHSQILAGAVVGPDVVIGERTVVAPRARLSHILIHPGSYVGELLQIENGYSVGHKLFRGKDGEKVIVTDRFLLGQTAGQPLVELVEDVAHRGLAAGLLALFAPWAAIEVLRKRSGNDGPVAVDEVLGHGDIDARSEAHFLPRIRMLRLADESSPLAWYPGLINVLRGEARIVGNRPQAPSSVAELPGDWAVKRFQAAPGLVSLPRADDDESDAALLAETIYASKRSLGLDARVLLAHVARPVLGPRWAQRIVGI